MEIEREEQQDGPAAPAAAALPAARGAAALDVDEEEQKDGPPAPAAQPRIPACEKKLRALLLCVPEGSARDDLIKILQEGGTYQFQKHLNLTIPKKGDTTRVSRETGENGRLIDGKEVCLTRNGRQSFWIHERHLDREDFASSLQNLEIPYSIMGATGIRDGCLVLVLQSDLDSLGTFEYVDTLANIKELPWGADAWLTEAFEKLQADPNCPIRAHKRLCKVKESAVAKPCTDWRSLNETPSEPRLRDGNGCPQVVRVLPGVKGRDLIVRYFATPVLQLGGAWESAVEVAPPMPMPLVRRPGHLSWDELPPAVLPGTLVISLVFHSNMKVGLLDWSREVLPANLYPWAIKEFQVSVAMLLRRLIGDQRGLIVVLVSCGLSKKEMAAIHCACKDTATTLIMPTQPTIEYMEASDPTLRELGTLAATLTRVAAQVESSLPFDTIREMASSVLIASSRMEHRPIIIGPDGCSHPIPIAGETDATLGEGETDATMDEPEAAADIIMTDAEEAVLPVLSAAAPAPAAAAAPAPVSVSAAKRRKPRQPQQQERPQRTGKFPILRLVPGTEPSMLPEQGATGCAFFAVTIAEHSHSHSRGKVAFLCQGMTGYEDKGAFKSRTKNLERTLKNHGAKGAIRVNLSAEDAATLASFIPPPSQPALLRPKMNRVFLLQRDA